MADPMFSIIVPSRGRPDDLSLALNSVLAQSFSGIELIAVIDGAKDDDDAAYRALRAKIGAANVTFIFLPYRADGHGPSFARNEGAAAASGRYLGFLDDDDIWTDSAHLSRAQAVIADAGDRIDLYLAQQEAVFPDGRADRGQWLAGIKPSATPDRWGTYRAGVSDLVGAGGFCHLNTTIIRRELFRDLGGFDETLRYEEDRDLFFRAIDAANEIRVDPAYVARHHVPEQRVAASTSTRIGDVSKYLFQLKLLDKQLLSAKHASIRGLARAQKGYTLRHMAVELSAQGKPGAAALYARQALALRFSIKWAFYTMFLTAKGLLR